MKSRTQKSDEILAIPMFMATVAILAFFALTVQEFMTREEHLSVFRLMIFFGLTWAMYPIFWAESLWHFAIDSPRKWETLYACFLPPLRLARRDTEDGSRMWLPILGWRQVDEDLHEEVERDLSVPMIIVAVMILPLLAIDFVWAAQLERSRELQIVVETGYSITWLAFTMEFIVMFSIVDKKIHYLKTHWVDLLIICLPLIAFLRAFHVTQIARLQHVTRATRVYRVRGLALRVWRGLLAMDVISRLARMTPEAKIETLRKLIEEKQREIENMEEEIAELELKIKPAKPNEAAEDLREGEAA